MSEACPEPPATLPSPRSDELLELESALTRVYRRGGGRMGLWPAFRHFGPLATARFDPHPPPPGRRRRGVMYLAAKGATRHGRVVPGLETGIAEAFQDTRFIDRDTDEPWAAIWTSTRAVRVLDLDSHWTTRAGGNRALTSGPRDVSRQWARAVYEQLEDLDGLAWRSSVLGVGRCVALWERARDALPRSPDFNRALADPVMLPDLSKIAGRIGYGLL